MSSEFTISTDKARLDRELIHRFLREDSYWAQNIPRDLVDLAIDNSLTFGVFDGDHQIGFARVITDFAVFAYLADVFVLPEYRGRGASKQLMRTIREHPPLQRLRRWHLVTRDAHGLYRQFGFRELEAPERHMEITKKNAYS
ncbi:MAG: GNAT family N-acetyltransferase [Acidobacteria bacterium]|nr:GNAT family N-acetyltransferase [Acidobacteriota bacterium]